MERRRCIPGRLDSMEIPFCGLGSLRDAFQSISRKNRALDPACTAAPVGTLDRGRTIPEAASPLPRNDAAARIRDVEIRDGMHRAAYASRI